MHKWVREARLSYWYPNSYGRSITAASAALVASGKPRELYGETEVASALIGVCSKKGCVVNSVSTEPDEQERSDHDMNVGWSGRGTSGHDGLECHRSIAIGNLTAAQESLPGCISTDSSE